MLTLAATRFNAETWRQNEEYRRKRGFRGCAYGVPRLIAQDVLPHSPVFVVEMNNTARRVEGIGMVPNAPYPGRAWIYDEGRYNLYTYISRFRLDRTELATVHIPGHPRAGLIWLLEQIVFAKTQLPNGPSVRGLRRLMSQTGITRLPRWLSKWRPVVKVRRRRLLVVHEKYDLRELIHSEFMKKYPDAPELGLSPSQMARAIRENSSADPGAASSKG